VELVKRYEHRPKYGPQYLFAPYYRPRPSYLGLQNTDPFVSASTSTTPAAIEERELVEVDGLGAGAATAGPTAQDGL
jgi:hypothetical protein